MTNGLNGERERIIEERLVMAARNSYIAEPRTKYETERANCVCV